MPSYPEILLMLRETGILQTCLNIDAISGILKGTSVLAWGEKFPGKLWMDFVANCLAKRTAFRKSIPFAEISDSKG